jgi:radical SAM superfamily enzyme YgiQ (UPF0313 family)
MDEIVPGKRTLNPPLGLATLAALCPDNWQVSIVDENVDSIPLDPEVDLIGVCGMGVQFPRQRELLAYYRARGYGVVAGGSYASLCPEKYESLADATVAGEAEYVWPAFCRDYESGCAQPLYRETGTVALTDSPTPRFDLLKLHLYKTASMQFSRGCPYMCDFCDIIVMFGRRPRAKRVAQIGLELDAGKRRFRVGQGSAASGDLADRAAGQPLLPRVAPRLERMLRDGHATLALRIETLRAQNLPSVHALLARIARHGDRVSVIVPEAWRGRLQVDSSVFRLVLAPPAG